MSERKYDDRHKPALWLSMLVLTTGTWILAVMKTYTLPSGRKMEALWYAALATPDNIRLWLPPLLMFFWALAVAIIIIQYTRTYIGVADFILQLRGTKFVSPLELKDICREYGKKQLRLMGIPVPTSKEHLHFEIVGSTGAGKSQVIEDYIESALARNDRMIVIDPNGTFMSKFFKEGDIILNPFDQRGMAWSIFNEIRTPYDVEQYSVSLIPKAPSTEQEQWNSMARTIVAETMLKLVKLGKGSTQQLVYWLTIANNEDLQKMLSDTSAAGMFHGAEETLGSVRAVLTRYVTAHKFMQEPVKGEVPFSIRTWLEKGMGDGKGSLWIPWREDMLPALKPLIACFIDVICGSVLSTDVQEATDMHLIIDETDSLDKLNYLVQAATKGRKHLFHIFCGFQSYAQLDATNGKDDALTLRNSLRNSVSLGVAEKDTYTAQQIHLALGEHVVTRRKLTMAAGAMGERASMTVQTEKEHLVLPADIHNLPPLAGYVKISGETPLARPTLKYKNRPRVTAPLILIDSKWTNEIKPQTNRFAVA